MARPKLDLNEKQIKELARIQCTMEEIAAVMSCSVDTLENRYAEIIRVARKSGLSSLRRAQWHKAVDEGHPALLIWLGKVLLGQREEMHVTTDEPLVRDLLKKWESEKSTLNNMSRTKDKPKA